MCTSPEYLSSSTVASAAVWCCRLSSLVAVVHALCRAAISLLSALRALSLLEVELASSPPSDASCVVPTRLPPPSLTAADFCADPGCLACACFFVLAISLMRSLSSPCRYIFYSILLLLLWGIHPFLRHALRRTDKSYLTPSYMTSPHPTRSTSPSSLIMPPP